jgi:hypothetical protein
MRVVMINSKRFVQAVVLLNSPEALIWGKEEVSELTK